MKASDGPIIFRRAQEAAPVGICKNLVKSACHKRATGLVAVGVETSTPVPHVVPAASHRLVGRVCNTHAYAHFSFRLLLQGG